VINDNELKAMDLANKTVLILGGSGLVGSAIGRRLLDFAPKKIVLVSLYEEEVRRAAEALDPRRGDTAVEYTWGNVFLPAQVARRPRTELLHDPEARRLVLGDILKDLSPEILERSFLYQLFRDYRPEAVVDCINTATAFAYQDVFTSSRDLLGRSGGGELSAETVEQHILTLTMPQLIRHIQIVVEATRMAGTEAYVKIGTSGTGGMGLNIPYTHSEERPSRTLLTKSAVAGAHSLLLFLIARTPGAPSVMEIKPTAAIAWRKIAFGPVPRWGCSVARFDCPEPIPVAEAFGDGAAGWKDLQRPVESVYIDVGENGVFAKDEFETVTSLGQMEFITPEEVAEYTVLELTGRSSGRDIVGALDSATAGPTYKAGVLRAAALHRLAELEREHGVRSVAFEMLGPPRLTKMLYESFIWSRLHPTVRALSTSDPDELAGNAAALIAADEDLRSLIISVGLPILVQGEKVYRASNVMVPPPPDGDAYDRVAARGWVDLRPAACRLWIERAAKMVEQGEVRLRSMGGSGSDVDWAAIDPDREIDPAMFAKWVFQYEDGGERIKR
jgi:hypothetical protein